MRRSCILGLPIRAIEVWWYHGLSPGSSSNVAD